MKSNRSKDAKILKKARFRVRGSFFLVFCALTAYYAGLSWLMTSPWISMPESMKTVFIASVGLEVMIAMVLLMWLYSEQPASRWGWFLFVLGEGAFTGWLAWQTISNPEGKLCWMAWGLCSMLKVWAMFSYGHWLKSSWWGQIFFDKTLKIY
ncbi:MAG: hypothetical protein HUJ54_04080, partial [Erysipelotrichaceae bacterium]|nr:hypothetical protein [Erysipelotrichaceae bacterium]